MATTTGMTIAMRTELGLLGAVAVIAGLGLLASSGPPPVVRGSAVLSRAPTPAAEHFAQDWEAWAPLAQIARNGQPREHAGAPAPTPIAIVEPPAAAAGIWATPAEFAESD